MKITQNNESTRGFFEATAEDRLAGKVTYAWEGEDKIILDSTEVTDDFRGQDVGKQLVYEAVNFARNNKVKIVPLCPFVKHIFDKDPTIHDVL